MPLSVIGTDQREAWMAALHSAQHDIHFLPEYHRLAEDRGEGQAQLFYYRDGRYSIAMPLLLNSLQAMTGLEAGSGWWAAHSVYGYTGPVLSHEDMPYTVLRDFRAALWRVLHEKRIISVFARLHPLLKGQRAALAGVGEYRLRGRTISIDLCETPEMQLEHYRHGHRSDVRRLQRLGVECIFDPTFEHLETFMDIYRETMDRVQANLPLMLDKSCFDWLRSMGKRFQLILGKIDNRIVCGGLFSLCDGVAHYHLAGTRNDALRMAPMKLVIDTARQWAWEQGAHTLHLGGGLSPQPDTLFHFKAGFALQRHDLAIWRWVLRRDLYDYFYTIYSRQQVDPFVAENTFPRYQISETASIAHLVV